MLKQEHIDFYREKGYLRVEKVLSREEVDELRRVTDEFVEKARRVVQSNEVFDLEPEHTPETPRLRRLKNPILQHPVYARTLRHSGILDPVEQLLGPGVRTNGNKLNMKSPGFGSAVEWHQDWAFYPHTNDDILAVGVAMDDMAVENGCLQVIPGSHQGRIYDHHLEGCFAGAVTEPDFDDAAAVPVEVGAGGISIHHVRVLHGSLPNRSQRPRRMLFFQYCSADSWPLMGWDWETYVQSFLRGAPCNQPRLAEVPVRLPLPPARRTGSIYETQTILRRSTFKKARAAG